MSVSCDLLRQKPWSHHSVTVWQHVKLSDVGVRTGCSPTERQSKILLFSKIKGGDYSEGYPVPTERRGVSKWTNVLSCDFRIRPRILPSALQASD